MTLFRSKAIKDVRRNEDKTVLSKQPVHPGEIVGDALIIESELTVTAAADLLGISRASMSKLLNGRSGISPEMAVRLSIALNTSSQLWLNLQTTYDLWVAEKSRKRLLREVHTVSEYISH